MKAPSCSSHIRREWVQFLVEEYLKKHLPQPIPRVDIKEFSVGRGAKAGDSFSSEVVTLDINAMLMDGDSSTSNAEYHFFVKFFSTDVIIKEITKVFQSDSKEYTILAEYVIELNSFQSSLTNDECAISIPDLIYGKHSEKDFVLVMENVKYDGYENRDKYLGLDLPHLRAAVIQLARLHALSYAHDKKQQLLLEKHPFFQLNNKILNFHKGFMFLFLDNGLALLETKKDKEELVRKIKASKENLIHEFSAVLRSSPGVPECMIHGDYWTNNLMFKCLAREEEKEEGGDSKQIGAQISCKVVDWGNAGWGSPVIDLQYLMHTSTTLQTREKHLEDLLQCYHSTFTEITTRVGTPIPSWSYNEFMDEWRRLSSYGFCIGIALTQGTLSKSNPYSQPRGSSVLDHSLCLPTKFLVNGIKKASAKALMPLMLKPSFCNLLETFNKTAAIRIRNEILSGSNKAMNERVLGLIIESSDKNIFQ